MLRSIWLVASCGLLASCSSRGDGNLGLAPQPVAIVADPSRVDRVDDLIVALRETPSSAYHRTLTTHLHIVAAAESEIEITGTLDVDGKGNLHVTQSTSHEDGYEAVFLDGELHVKARYLAFSHRRPETGEVAKLRAPIDQALADELAKLGSAIQLSKQATGDKLVVTISGKGKDSGGTDGWGKSLVVDELSGTIELDPKSAVLRSAKLAGTYHFDRDGQAVKVTFTHDEVVDQSPTALAAIVAPLDSLPTPRRVRPQLDRQALLDGLPSIVAAPRAPRPPAAPTTAPVEKPPAKSERP